LGAGDADAEMQDEEGTWDLRNPTLETARSHHNDKDPNPPLMRASVLLDG